MTGSSKANWWILGRDHKYGQPLDESKVFFARNRQEFENVTQVEGEEYELSAYHVANCPSIDGIKRWLWETHGIRIESSIYIEHGEIRFQVACKKVTNYCGSIHTIENFADNISGFADVFDAEVEMINAVVTRLLCPIS